MKPGKLKIRRASTNDVPAITRLFYDTITHVNKADYTSEQVEAWRSNAENTEGWKSRINEQHFFLAELDDILVGFSSIAGDGYLDFMFVHKDYQGRGIATQLLQSVEQVAADLKLSEVWARVSITARPFFKSKGFAITKTFVTQVGDVHFDDAEMRKKYVTTHL